MNELERLAALMEIVSRDLENMSDAGKHKAMMDAAALTINGMRELLGDRDAVGTLKFFEKNVAEKRKALIQDAIVDIARQNYISIGNNDPVRSSLAAAGEGLLVSAMFALGYEAGQAAAMGRVFQVADEEEK